jgi:hypothetical protein
MAMSTGGKVAVAFGVLTGVGVGLYFLLKPSTASAATTNPLAVAQAKALAAQRAAAALQVAAKSSGSAQDAQKAALAISAAKVLADAAKNIKIGGGGGSAKTQPNSSKKTNANVPSIPITNAQKSTMADAYYCNYNPDDVKCGGQGLPSDLCQTSPEAPECQALLESSDYCTKYPQNCDSSGETYCSLYPDAYYCGGSGSGSDSFDTTPIDTGSDWQSYDWYCYDNPQYC